MRSAKTDARILIEAARRAGLGSDAQAIKDQLEQIRRGLPAEDEFAALCVWSGRCRLIHGLNQEQFPPESKTSLQVPDFLAVFEVEDREVQVLVEVKTTSKDVLVFPSAYYRRLVTYAAALGLPLVIAWRQRHGIWTLFDIREMGEGPQGRRKANFFEVFKQTLMGVLLGDFTANVKAGVGLTIKLREDRKLSDTQYIVTVTEAYWSDTAGRAVNDLAGNFMPLLLACPSDYESTREGRVFCERFYVTDESGVLAHRTMCPRRCSPKTNQIGLRFSAVGHSREEEIKSETRRSTRWIRA